MGLISTSWAKASAGRPPKRVAQAVRDGAGEGMQVFQSPHAAHALRSGSQWQIAGYILFPMVGEYIDRAPEFELFVAGYEMLIAGSNQLVISPADPAHWAV